MFVIRHTVSCLLIVAATSGVQAFQDADKVGHDGIWKPLSAILGGAAMPAEVVKSITLKVASEKYEVTITGRPEADKGTCVVDGSTTPKRMTIRGEDGPNKGKTILAIYDVTGKDTMRVCYDLSGLAFPEDFKSEANTLQYLVEYKRQPQTGELKGKVISVEEGDLLTVQTNDKKEFKVRLNGIDAPENSQPFGMNSKEFIEHLVGEKMVRVVTHGEDRSGRTIGDVFFRTEKLGKDDPDTELNFMLVANGFAWHFVRFAPDNKKLASAEKQARELKLGLWAEAGAISPWDWRKKEADKLNQAK